MGFRETVESRHGGFGAFFTVGESVMTGCLREKKHSQSKGNDPDKAKARGDAVGCCVVHLYGAVVDAV